MIRLRHLLHPVHSVKSLYGKVHQFSDERTARRTFRSIRRGMRDQCWCGGELLPFKWHPSYGTCAECGCHVNRHPPLAGELRRMYSFDFYWHTWQAVRGHPQIEERPMNDRADGRLDYWLDLVRRFGPPNGQVVEVGCAHGILLAELNKLGYNCVGLEVDRKTADWTRKNTRLDVRSGLFPGAELPGCDLFLGFDVFEHSLCPKQFLQEAAQLLRPGKVAILQTPIDYHVSEPPFAEMYEKTFDDQQHLYVFTPESIRRLAEHTGFDLVAEEKWRIGHEIVVLRKHAQNCRTSNRAS